MYATPSIPYKRIDLWPIYHLASRLLHYSYAAKNINNKIKNYIFILLFCMFTF